MTSKKALLRKQEQSPWHLSLKGLYYSIWNAVTCFIFSCHPPVIALYNRGSIPTHIFDPSPSLWWNEFLSTVSYCGIFPLVQLPEDHNGHKPNQVLVFLWGHFIDSCVFLSNKTMLPCVVREALTRLIRCLPLAERPVLAPHRLNFQTHDNYNLAWLIMSQQYAALRRHKG